jgi:hypothetical protein
MGRRLLIHIMGALYVDMGLCTTVCKTKLLGRKDLKTYIVNAFNYPTLSWIRWRRHPPLLCDGCLDSFVLEHLAETIVLMTLLV